MRPKDNNLEWLQSWYQRQCNGDWEHSSGMRLQPLESDGWQLTIHLAGTTAADVAPKRIKLDTASGDWISCRIANRRFEGSCDPHRLEQIIGVFRRWVEAPQS